MKTINEILREGRGTKPKFPKTICPRIICNDGFNLSVQASAFNYCSPRIDFLREYDSVEIGFPSEADDLILNYAEQKEIPTDTVYGYVPVDIVDQLISKHGGFKEYDYGV